MTDNYQMSERTSIARRARAFINRHSGKRTIVKMYGNYKALNHYVAPSRAENAFFTRMIISHLILFFTLMALAIVGTNILDDYIGPWAYAIFPGGFALIPVIWSIKWLFFTPNFKDIVEK